MVLVFGCFFDGMCSKLEELYLIMENDYVFYYNGFMVVNVGIGEIIY